MSKTKFSDTQLWRGALFPASVTALICDRESFAICAILITMAWLFGEVRSFFKLKVQLPLPKTEGEKL